MPARITRARRSGSARQPNAASPTRYVCEKCPANTYKAFVGDAVGLCLACPAGTVSRAGAVAQDECRAPAVQTLGEYEREDHAYDALLGLVAHTARVQSAWTAPRPQYQDNSRRCSVSYDVPVSPVTPLADPIWVLSQAPNYEPCSVVCSNVDPAIPWECDAEAQTAVDTPGEIDDIAKLLGFADGCDQNSGSSDHAGAPWIRIESNGNVNCRMFGGGGSSTCTSNLYNTWHQPICRCRVNVDTYLSQNYGGGKGLDCPDFTHFAIFPTSVTPSVVSNQVKLTAFGVGDDPALPGLLMHVGDAAHPQRYTVAMQPGAGSLLMYDTWFDRVDLKGTAKYVSLSLRKSYGGPRFPGFVEVA